MSRRWIINGKWLSTETTGTQRYATEVARRVIAAPDRDVTLVLPAGVLPPDWAPAERVRHARTRGLVFEQLTLPILARRAILINLAGPAPMIAGRQVVVLFDLSWKRFPETVSRGFAHWYAILYSVLVRKKRSSIVTISEFSRRELVSEYGTNPAAVSVATCGGDHYSTIAASRPPVADEVADGFVLCLGTLNKRKNLDAVLPSLEAARIPTVVVGDKGPSRVYGSAESPGEVKSHVKFPGRLTDAEISWLMDNAIALVFPSIYEGFGLPIVEAQSRGCPVICVDTGAMAEASGGAALQIGTDGSGVIEAVIRASDPEVRARLVAAGRVNAAKHTWASATDVISRQAELLEDG